MDFSKLNHLLKMMTLMNQNTQTLRSRQPFLRYLYCIKESEYTWVFASSVDNAKYLYCRYGIKSGWWNPDDNIDELPIELCPPHDPFTYHFDDGSKVTHTICTWESILRMTALVSSVYQNFDRNPKGSETFDIKGKDMVSLTFDQWAELFPTLEEGFFATTAR